jgi:two-component system response regulator HydG
MTKRIFVIDDDKEHAESLADILEMRGYEVDVAHSGEAALARARETGFDIALMDVKLPGINGVETYREFRRLHPQARVMMMTGFSVGALVAEAIDQGALGVLHKPFSPQALLEFVESTP